MYYASDCPYMFVILCFVLWSGPTLTLCDNKWHFGFIRGYWNVIVSTSTNKNRNFNLYGTWMGSTTKSIITLNYWSQQLDSVLVSDKFKFKKISFSLHCGCSLLFPRRIPMYTHNAIIFRHEQFSEKIYHHFETLLMS